MLTISPIKTASLEVLWFDVPELAASRRLAAMAADGAATLGVELTTIDVWANPSEVVAHGVLVGPTVIVLADGQEVARLAGPWRCRHIERFFTRLATPRPVLSWLVHV